MSNNKTKRRGASRSHLLASASGMVIAAMVMAGDPALAANAAHQPMLWIEAGWHDDQVRDSANGFAMPFDSLIPPSGITGPLTGSLNLSNSQGDDGKISFRPDGSDWVFSASVRYGRSNGKGHVHQSKALPYTSFLAYHVSIPSFGLYRTFYRQVEETASRVNADTVTAETHYILDFEAGKDVGLGLFGHGSTSTLEGGVRFASFTTALNVQQFHAKPDVHLSHFHYTYHGADPSIHGSFTGNQEVWHDLAGNPHSSHNFIGVGPTISWDASALLWGDQERSGFSLDWSVNAAVLFGRQKNKAHHQTIGTSECYGYRRKGGRAPCQNAPSTVIQDTSSVSNSKRATVPNVGGSIGISYRLSDIKLNAGYRADYFFHVIDTGLVGSKAITRSFNGPYASVSIGIGN